MTDGLTASDVAVLTGNNGRNNDGWGGDGCWWIILFLIFGMFGWGGYGNGWGGNGGANSPAFQGYATRADIDAALSTQGIESGIQNISTQLCNGFAGVNSNISNLGYQLQDCCCQTQRAVDGVNYNMAMQTNTLQQALCSGFRDVIDSQNAGTQRIIDTITQDKIQSLQTELQSAQLQLANVSQTNNIINTLRPTPVPAYITCSTYQAAYGYGNGCGNCACLLYTSPSPRDA